MLKKNLLALCLLVLVLSGCSPVKKALQIKGSDTMVNLAQAWAEDYLNRHTTANIAVTGGGSGTGIASILAGVADIAQSSRDIEEKEITLAKSKGIDVRTIHVANDGVVLIVNKKNPINKLTIKQLSDIFSGRVTNWQELGGANEKIVALSRDRSSGTHVYFLQSVVKQGNKKDSAEFAPNVLMMPSSQAIVEEVIANTSAIGYIGLGYLTKQEKPLAVAKTEKKPYVLPTVSTVINKSYPIARPLHFYVNGEPSGDVKDFVDFVLSDVGQKIVLKMDFVPIR